MALHRLSARLRAVLAQTQGASHLTDVGTDHALLPLAWLHLHPHAQALGIDCAAKPLKVAATHRARSRHGHRLTLVQDHGLGAQPMQPGGVVTICGIGGRSIVQILEQAPQLTPKGGTRLVLAPQDHAPMLRSALWALGFGLVAEDALWDRGQYYPILVAQGPRPPHANFGELELEFGPHLLRQAHPALAQYLRLQLRRLETLIQRPGANAPALHAQLSSHQTALAHYFAEPEPAKEPALAGCIDSARRS